MSRDPRARDDARDHARGDARDEELLTAYVDGVGELDRECRRRVEARLTHDPDTSSEQVAVREMIDRLRELPSEGTEPDWVALERSIREAVGEEVPRPWWRRWRWLAPVSSLLAAAAVLLVMWSRPASLEPALPHPIATVDERTMPEPQAGEDVLALWLDGAAVDVALPAEAALSEVTLGEDTLGERAAGDPELTYEDDMDLLPSTNLAWLDQLDEEAIERAERWLARGKG